MTKLEVIQNRWDEIVQKKYFIPLILIIFSMLMTILMVCQQDDASTTNLSHKSYAADTYIPSGHVLVPIEVQNVESLDSLIGQFGIVDLYKKGARKPLKTSLRIIRSPNDPSQFAVLVDESIAPEIVEGAFEPLRVVLKSSRSQEMKKTKITQRKIVYE